MNKSNLNRSPKLNPTSISNPASPASPEKFVNAQEASVALNLPLYFFINPVKRDSLGIPYYFIHRMVRYRLTELHAWHVNRASQAMQDAASRKQKNVMPNVMASAMQSTMPTASYPGGAYA